MKILAFESSAKAASVALCEDGNLIAEHYRHSGLTHSQTLLPMAESLLKIGNLELSDLDCLAVSVGPGSFTGLRIGTSLVKGLCWASDKPAIGVSTLEAMAFLCRDLYPGIVICCCMDARRNQVYNALFRAENNMPERLCPDRALSLNELYDELKDIKSEIFFVGDGAGLCYTELGSALSNCRLAPSGIRMQRALGVCLAAENIGKPASADLLIPTYLRLSQAERERQAKLF
ncbi:MAG: tRNA (adenosine(37)-N6)-threonylcarbamoyltransferase complex dimerization subunit type 1 TsaB [Ruminococcaceae bacterium]|nr:tRNA (adenosine(37)-N6)-threonylcarbamoyltransferase complex dimerization subunit type 1 TsaB [Oscillospiraceae bacterium]